MTDRIEPVEVVEYDPAWPRWFEDERGRLRRVLGSRAVGIDHIGSTAVPGLAAKPVIDILVTVAPFPLAPAVVADVEALGYEYRGEKGVAGRQYFRTRRRARHLHVFAPGSVEAEQHLLFRDYLRMHPAAVREYEALKHRLAAVHPLDRAAYAEGKAEWVRAFVDTARVGAASKRP